MKYRSTRCTCGCEGIPSYRAIKDGIAPDGGLYMPESIPSIDMDRVLKTKNYPELAYYVLSLYLDDYSPKALAKACTDAYSMPSFSIENSVELTECGNGITSLELWHGPTAAFKDMALQIMPKLLAEALRMAGEPRDAHILVATSGDTGKAALEGYRDLDKTRITVFYPIDGVSTVQKMQMVSQLGSNVSVCGIRGNFDDAQNGVKAIFGNKNAAERLEREHNAFFSSANSINWGRLAPQIIYYVFGYCEMVRRGTIAAGDIIDICVPTGNFGNIFAAYIAKQMGMPFGRLICASNKNNILTDFLTTGVYDRNRHFYTTTSPSMDILISSNLERLLYFVCGPEKTASYMASLARDGRYTVDADDMARIRESFVGYYCDEDGTAETISDVYSKFGYLCDTHTAVGYHCAVEYHRESASERKILLASTASPYKFAADVYFALSGKRAQDDFASLTELSALTGVEIPAPLKDIDKRTVRFDDVIDPADMLDYILSR